MREKLAGVDLVLSIWFGLTALSVAFVAWDLFTRTPEMKVMKWGWILVTLYTGPIGFIVYWLSCREPTPGAHERFVAPLWKQSVGSTIHCMAGDATGIILAALATRRIDSTMGADAALEYAAGFALGLFIFQALFMKEILRTGYWQAVRQTWFPEWLSMNCVMAGMIPVMVILMTHDMRAMEPTSLRFWEVMSLATIVGAVVAYPVNRWLVKYGLKHGMGTERALGKGGSRTAEMAGMPEMRPHAGVSASRKLAVATLTVAMLAGGVALAGHYGSLSMRSRATRYGGTAQSESLYRFRSPDSVRHWRARSPYLLGLLQMKGER